MSEPPAPPRGDGAPYRPTDLSQAGARRLAEEHVRAQGAGVSDDVIERQWGWAFHRIDGLPLPPGPSSWILVLRDGTVEVPGSTFRIEDYEASTGVVAPRPSPAARARWHVRVLLHGSWIVLVFVLVFVAAWWLELGTKR